MHESVQQKKKKKKVQFQKKLFREQARTAHYSYLTEFDSMLLFHTLRGAN